jgi:uncharacterized protein HemY
VARNEWGVACKGGRKIIMSLLLGKVHHIRREKLRVYVCMLNKKKHQSGCEELHVWWKQQNASFMLHAGDN